MSSIVLTLFGLLPAALGASGPLPPLEAMGLFRVAPGVRIELVAAEPDVVDPVALAFDEHRAMYVVENRGYPEDANGKGSIALFSDDNGDGTYTRVATFYENLNFPNGVMAWQGGILVTDAPHVLFLKDTNGDGLADVRRVMLDGFFLGGSTQLRMSHPTLGLDNWIHFTNGLSGGEVFDPSKSEVDAVSMGRNDLRFNPRTGALEKTAGMAQFGLAFDDFGNKFTCSNRIHIEHAVLSPIDLARNPALEFTQTAHSVSNHGAAARVFPIRGARTAMFADAGTFTAACGLVIYRGEALPVEYRGNAFVCEPTGNLVHRDVLIPSGSTFTAVRGREGVEFLTSEDAWFSPVFLANGPAGALYVCDMYRGEIQHPAYLPGELGAAIDFDAGKDRGRIFRLVGDGVSNLRAENPFDGADGRTLVSMLSSADAWEHETAHRLLLERRDTVTAAHLRETLVDGRSALGSVHALNLLDGLGELQEDDIVAALKSEHGALREQAATLARQFNPPPASIAHGVRLLRRDPIVHVRYAAALALGDMTEPESVDALVELLLSDTSTDTWLRTAVLSGIDGRVVRFLERYLDSVESESMDQNVMNALGFMLARGGVLEEWTPSADAVLRRVHPDGGSWKMHFVNGVLRGARQSGAFDSARPPVEALRDRLSPDGADYLDWLVDEARYDVRDSDVSHATRVAAIELLGLTRFDVGGMALGALLTPRTPSKLQLRTVRSLFNITDRRVFQLMLAEKRWAGFTESVRGVTLSKLFVTRQGVEHLITAVESGAVPERTLPVQYRHRLLRYDDLSLRARARKVIGNKKQPRPIDVYNAYKPVLKLAANPAAGREVFERTCASCHTFEEMGHEVGPDLTGIETQTSESILLNVLAPNAQRHPDYESYEIATDALEDFSGILVAESDTSITLRAAYGIENTIPRDAIVSMRVSGLSMMPSGLEAAMSRQELRDLIGFLKRENAVK